MWLFNLLFSSLSQLWYVEVRIPRSVSVSPLEFEITRVDCICFRNRERGNGISAVVTYIRTTRQETSQVLCVTVPRQSVKSPDKHKQHTWFKQTTTKTVILLEMQTRIIVAISDDSSIGRHYGDVPIVPPNTTNDNFFSDFRTDAT